MADELLNLIREQTRGLYDPICRIGEDAQCVAYLGRDLENQGLVVLRLEDGGGDAEEMTLTVGHVLDETIPPDGTHCPSCPHEGYGWGIPCPKCGHTVVHAGISSELTTEDLLEAITEAAGDQYMVLGALETEPEGTVFFAREKASTRVVGLGLHAEADDHFELVQIWAEPASRAKATGPTGASTTDEEASGREVPAGAAVGAGGTGEDSQTPAATSEGDASTDAVDAAAAPTGAPPPEYQGATPWASKGPPPPQRGGPSPVVLGGSVVGLVALGAFLFWPRSPDTEEAPGVVAEAPATAEPQPVAGGDSTSAGDSLLAAETADVDTATTAPAPTTASGSPASAEPAAPTTGRVRIEGSFPSGTRISVDGSVVNGTSFSRPPGRYTVAVAAPGYFPTTTELRVEAGTTQSWRPELRRLERTVDPEPEEETTPPAGVGPEGEQAAAPGAPAADATQAISQVLERYRAALQSHNMGNLRDAFFGIPSSEEQRWQPFFDQFTEGRFTDLAVGLQAQAPRFFDDNSRAEVDFSLTLRYTDPNGAPPPNPIPLRAVLRGSADGWLLLRIDPQG